MTATTTKRLRIAMLVHRFGCRFGGAEAYVEHLVRELCDRHDVTVVAFDAHSTVDVPVMTIRVPQWLPGWIKAWMFARRAHRLTAGRFDIVHSHMNGWAGDVQTVHVTPVHYHIKYRGSRLKRFRAFMSIRKQAYLRLERARFGAGKTAVAVSRRLSAQMTACLPLAAPVSVIAPGVMPALVLPGERHHQRAALGCRDSDMLCLLVARNAARKGLATVLHAASLLPACRFVVVGADAEAHRLLDGAVPTVRDRVALVPPTAHVAPWYCAADAYVHPTKEDTFGMAPLEAMAYGLPVVVSGAGHCGLACELEDGVDALLLSDPSSGRELAEKLQRLAGQPALRQQLSTQGRVRAARQGWRDVAQQYEAIYLAALSVRPPASPAAPENQSSDAPRACPVQAATHTAT